MRMKLFSAVAACGLLLATQVPALAQGAFAYPPNGLDFSTPAATPAPAEGTQSHSSRNPSYYDYYGEYRGTSGSYSAPYGFYAPGNVQIGR